VEALLTHQCRRREGVRLTASGCAARLKRLAGVDLHRVRTGDEALLEIALQCGDCPGPAPLEEPVTVTGLAGPAPRRKKGGSKVPDICRTKGCGRFQAVDDAGRPLGYCADCLKKQEGAPPPAPAPKKEKPVREKPPEAALLCPHCGQRPQTKDKNGKWAGRCTPCSRENAKQMSTPEAHAKGVATRAAKLARARQEGVLEGLRLGKRQAEAVIHDRLGEALHMRRDELAMLLAEPEVSATDLRRGIVDMIAALDAAATAGALPGWEG